MEKKILEHLTLLSVRRAGEFPERRHKLYDDLGLDSLDIMELSLMIEQDAGIEFTDEDIEHFKTVGDVLAITAAKTTADAKAAC